MSTQISQDLTYTVDEFINLSDLDKQFELVKGRLKAMSPAGRQHS